MPEKNRVEWSDALTQQLTDLWMQENPVLSCKEIAERLTIEYGTFITKNMVLGKVHRIGLPMRIEPAEKPIKTSPFEGLSQSSCHYPIGHPGDKDFHFCGRKPLKPGKSYCVEHAAVAYFSTKKVKVEA